MDENHRSSWGFELDDFDRRGLPAAMEGHAQSQRFGRMFHQGQRQAPLNSGAQTWCPGVPEARLRAVSDGLDFNRRMPAFEVLVQEAASASVDGWDFSWLDGRATEERPSWGYQRLLSTKLEAATAALDIQTGGGEVLASAGAENFPRVLVATEGWAAERGEGDGAASSPWSCRRG